MKCFNRKLFCRYCWFRLLIYWLVAEAKNVAAISCSIECQVRSPKCCFKYTTTSSKISSSSTSHSISSSKIENDNRQLMLVAENMPHLWCLHVMPTQEAWHYKKHRQVRHIKSTQPLVEMEPEETHIDDRLKPFTIFGPMNIENQNLDALKQPESIEKDYDGEEEYEDNNDDDDDDDVDDDDDDNNDNDNDNADEEDENDDDDVEQNNNEYEENDDVNEEEINFKASKKGKRKRQKYGGKRKRRKKKDQTTQHFSLGQPANLLLASLTSLPTPMPIHHHNYAVTHKPLRKKHDKGPIKHIKYILHKGGLLKKKKQEYLSHLGYVFLPLVKFVAFFTVLNPFTLAVFFFMLISPVVFGILGFTALSLILRPVMNLIFAVKHRVGDINRRKYRYQQHKRLPNRQRPITIHKHYYQQRQQQQQHKKHPPQYRPIPLNTQRIPLKYLGPHRRDMKFFSEEQESGQRAKIFNEQSSNFSYHFNPILPHFKYQQRQTRPLTFIPKSEVVWQP